MSQWTYRAASFVSAGNGAGDSLAIAKPTGTAAGDLIVVVTYWEPDTQTITQPVGFTKMAEIANPGAFMLQGWYAVAGASEPSTYTFTPSATGQWRTILAAAYSGGTGSGPWQDGIATTNQADVVLVASQTAPSLTTTGTDRLLIFGYANIGGNNPGSTTGAASSLRGTVGGVVLADGARPTAGATGTTGPAGGVVGNETFAAFHAALISDTAVVSASLAARRYDFTRFPTPRLRR